MQKPVCVGAEPFNFFLQTFYDVVLTGGFLCPHLLPHGPQGKLDNLSKFYFIVDVFLHFSASTIAAGVTLTVRYHNIISDIKFFPQQL